MNELLTSSLPMAILLSVAVKAVVDYLKQPIKQQFPEVNLWWVVYISFALGAACSWFGGVDIFSAVVADPTLSKILTAATVGGGASLIHDIFDKPH